MNINKLIKEAHENAVAKGFWECEECNGSGALRYHDYKEDYERIRDCYKCNGTGKHGDVIRKLALVNSELYKALEVHRFGKFCESNIYDFELPIYQEDSEIKSEIGRFECWIKDTFEDKIADVLIRIFDLCGYLNIPLRKREIKNIGNNPPGIPELILIVNDFVNEYYQSTVVFKSASDGLNDAFNFVMYLCESNNIDIEKHIDLKMAYNKNQTKKTWKAN